MLETVLILLAVVFDTMLVWAILGSLTKKINEMIAGGKKEYKGFGSTISKSICGLIAFIYGGFLAYIQIKNSFSFELLVLFFLLPLIIFLLMVIMKMANEKPKNK